MKQYKSPKPLDDKMLKGIESIIRFVNGENVKTPLEAKEEVDFIKSNHLVFSQFEYFFIIWKMAQKPSFSKFPKWSPILKSELLQCFEVFKMHKNDPPVDIAQRPSFWEELQSLNVHIKVK